LRDTDLFQQRPGLGFAVSLVALAHHLLRQAQVFQHSHVREQVEVLEHHADFAAVGIDVGLGVGQLQAIDGHMALVEMLQAVEAAQERRFARPRRAEHDHHFALGDLSGDVIHSPYHLATGVEDFQQITDFNHFAQASARAGWQCATAAG